VATQGEKQERMILFKGFLRSFSRSCALNAAKHKKDVTVGDGAHTLLR
jgi:hypothetical protein